MILNKAYEYLQRTERDNPEKHLSLRKNVDNNKNPPAVPKAAEYILFLVLSKKDRDAVLGDLEETFHEAYAKYGLRKAQFAYWFQVLNSIGPFVWARASKLFGWGLGAAILAWIKSQISSN
jgi:hypothetical protein